MRYAQNKGRLARFLCWCAGHNPMFYGKFGRVSSYADLDKYVCQRCGLWMWSTIYEDAIRPWNPRIEKIWDEAERYEKRVFGEEAEAEVEAERKKLGVEGNEIDVGLVDIRSIPQTPEAQEGPGLEAVRMGDRMLKEAEACRRNRLDLVTIFHENCPGCGVAVHRDDIVRAQDLGNMTYPCGSKMVRRQIDILAMKRGFYRSRKCVENEMSFHRLVSQWLSNDTLGPLQVRNLIARLFQAKSTDKKAE